MHALNAGFCILHNCEKLVVRMRDNVASIDRWYRDFDGDAIRVSAFLFGQLARQSLDFSCFVRQVARVTRRIDRTLSYLLVQLVPSLCRLIVCVVAVQVQSPFQILKATSGCSCENLKCLQNYGT